MTGLVRDLRVAVPSTVEEALATLGDGARWTPVAGATDTSVALHAGQSIGDHVLSLHKLRPELRFIAATRDRLRVGALTTFRDLAASSAVLARLPMLASAARAFGAPAIQCRATVGGNVAHASPAGDSLPIWSVLEADAELRSAHGLRRVPFSKLFLGPRVIDRRADELLVAVSAALPPPRVKQWFRKAGTRRAQAAGKVVFAALADVDHGIMRDVRLSLGAVAPTPVRLPATEALLRDHKLTPALAREAIDTLRTELAPFDDVRSTAAHRSRVAGHLLAEFLASLP